MSLKRTNKANVCESSAAKRHRAEPKDDERVMFVYSWSSFDLEREKKYVVKSTGEEKTCKERALCVVAYGVDEHGRTGCMRFAGVYTRILFEFPDRIDLADKNIAAAALEGVRSMIFKYDDKKLVSIKSFRPLYGLKENKLMVEAFLGTQITANTIAKACREKKINSKFYFMQPNEEIAIHETAATPELQVATARGVGAVGWVKCTNIIEVPEDDEFRHSRCDFETVCHVRNLGPAHGYEERAAPKLTLVSWDCEAFIEDISQPGKSEKDSIFQISVVSNAGHSILLTIGQPKYESVEGIDVQCFNNERDLLIAFGEAMRAIRPHVTTGWNVFGFDWELLNCRATKLMCVDKALHFSFLRSAETKIVQRETVSAAAGRRLMSYPIAEGMIHIDMLNIIKENIKLASYRLDVVGRLLLDEGKDDVSLSELFKCYNALKAGDTSDTARELLWKVGHYCVQDSDLVVRIAEHQMSVISLLEFSAVVNTPPQLVHTCGQQLRFYNSIYTECRGRRWAVQSNKGGEYSGQPYTGAYVHDPKPGLYNMVTSQDVNSMYPSVIDSMNVDFSTVVPGDEPTDIPDSEFKHLRWGDHLNCPHDTILKEKKDAQEEVARLKATPGIDKTTLFHAERHLATIVKRIAARGSKTMCYDRHFKIYQTKRGILPTIIVKLLKARAETRRKMKTLTDKSRIALLNQRQLAYKVAANSMYGAMGVNEGRLKCKHAAMCVTAAGRMSIIKASDFLVEKWGMSKVYGDTDSVYGQFPELVAKFQTKAEQAKALWEHSMAAAKATSEMLGGLTIEFEEKIYDKFLILSKKRYVYRTISPDGEVSKKLGNRGVLLTRRDYNKFTKNLYERLIQEIFDDATLEDARQILAQHFLSLFHRQVPIEDLCVSKGVNPFAGGDEPKGGVATARGTRSAETKSLYGYTLRKPEAPEHLTGEDRYLFFARQLPMQMQLAVRMRNRGQLIPDGNRIDYCYTTHPSNSNIMTESQLADMTYVPDAGQVKAYRIEECEYVKRTREITRIDYLSSMKDTYTSHNELGEVVWSRPKPFDCVYMQFKRKANVVAEIKALCAPRIMLSR